MCASGLEGWVIIKISQMPVFIIVVDVEDLLSHVASNIRMTNTIRLLDYQSKDQTTFLIISFEVMCLNDIFIVYQQLRTLYSLWVFNFLVYSSRELWASTTARCFSLAFLLIFPSCYQMLFINFFDSHDTYEWVRYFWLLLEISMDVRTDI